MNQIILFRFIARTHFNKSFKETFKIKSGYFMFLIFSSFQTTESIIMLPLDEDFLCLDFSCKGGGGPKI